MEALEPIAAMFKQIYNQPACLLIIIAVNVFVFMWEAFPWLPSRLIVVVGPVAGAILYPLLASRDSVPYDVPHPIAVLVINGLASGLVAVALHTAVVALLRKKFGWPPEPGKPNQPPTPKDP